MAAKLPGTTGAHMPSFIRPCLATLRDNVPSGAQWLHEIKFDGYRLQLHKRENDTRLYTRRGNNWTKRFPSLVEAAWHLPVKWGEAQRARRFDWTPRPRREL